MSFKNRKYSKKRKDPIHNISIYIHISLCMCVYILYK